MTKFHQDDYVDVIQYVCGVLGHGFRVALQTDQEPWRENSRALQNQPMGVALEIEI